MNSLNIYERLVYISISELIYRFSKCLIGYTEKSIRYMCTNIVLNNLTGPLLYYHTFSFIVHVDAKSFSIKTRLHIFQLMFI